jgi:large subunit ribosomal protein L25
VAEVKLAVLKRDDTGKGAARRTRAAGKVPAVVYGHGMEPLTISVDRREFLTALKTDAGMNVLLDLDIDGEATLALTKELQRDPVRGTLLHADFIKIDRDQTVELEVPLHVVGEAAGAKEGGVLQHPLTSLHVRVKVTEVPESVEADVSALNIGDALRVSDLSAAVGYEVLNDPDTVVASVSAPVSEAELEAMEAEAGIEAEVPEGEEAAAAEGEAAAAEGEEPSEEPSAEAGESSEGEGSN